MRFQSMLRVGLDKVGFVLDVSLTSDDEREDFIGFLFDVIDA